MNAHLELKKYLQYSGFDSGLSSVLMAISQGSILIQKKISRLSLEGLEGSAGTKNIHNESAIFIVIWETSISSSNGMGGLESDFIDSRNDCISL